MRILVLVTAFAFWLTAATATCPAFNQDPLDYGNTVEPYPVLTKGIKLSFSQVDKQYLGRRCSVYFKPGQPESMVGTGIEPAKMFVHKDGLTIENGELAGMSKHSIDVIWYFSPFGAHGGSISDKSIDYIMVEEK